MKVNATCSIHRKGTNLNIPLPKASKIKIQLHIKKQYTEILRPMTSNIHYTEAVNNTIDSFFFGAVTSQGGQGEQRFLFSFIINLCSGMSDKDRHSISQSQ